ncbi:MAG: hypothetical protein IPH13_20125 [Planctomycetes bacterium]|nr:hypothetical protein [Planctomycetota bacterium]
MRSIIVTSAFTTCSVRGCTDVGEYMLVADPALPNPTRTYIVTCASHSVLLRRYAAATLAAVQHECEPLMSTLATTIGLPSSVWEHWWRYFRHMLAKANAARSVCHVIRTCAYVPSGEKRIL